MPLLSIDSSYTECQGGTDFIVRLPENFIASQITLVDVRVVTFLEKRSVDRTTPYYIVQVECPDMIDHMIHLLGNGTAVPALGKIRYSREIQDYDVVGCGPYIFPTGPVNLRQLRIRFLLPNGTPVKGLEWNMVLRV
jgi:hypothetical protein